MTNLTNVIPAKPEIHLSIKHTLAVILQLIENKKVIERSRDARTKEDSPQRRGGAKNNRQCIMRRVPTAKRSKMNRKVCG